MRVWSHREVFAHAVAKDAVAARRISEHVGVRPSALSLSLSSSISCVRVEHNCFHLNAMSRAWAESRDERPSARHSRSSTRSTTRLKT